MVTFSKYAKLNKDELSKVQELEKQIGKIVIAYDNDKSSPYAPLTEDQVQKIRRLEDELGVILLAFTQ